VNVRVGKYPGGGDAQVHVPNAFLGARLAFTRRESDHNRYVCRIIVIYVDKQRVVTGIHAV
jgi:hypothetical protein